jgi:DNA-binding response OmpR family regulator
MVEMIASDTTPTMRRVLLVEDDEILRRNYEALLDAHRFAVCACATKSEAIVAFKRDTFDVVILEVSLGGEYEAGFDLCQKFREQRKTTPIIFLTERNEDDDRIRGLRLGAADYLSKTTTSGAFLVARIHSLIRANRKPANVYAYAFISYVRENRDIVDRLALALQASGAKIWLDRNDIMPGQYWKHAITEAIKKGAFFIACFSKELNERSETYMHGELRLAMDRLRNMPKNRIWFIPVLLNETEIPSHNISDHETLKDIIAVMLYENWKGA